MTVSPTVNFDEIATRTEGFSGADLQALLYNCHLDVIHRAIQDVPTPETGPKDIDEIPVKYTTVGGSDNKPLRSKAEETALQRRVCQCGVPDFPSAFLILFLFSSDKCCKAQLLRESFQRKELHLAVVYVWYYLLIVQILYSLQNQIQRKDILKALKSTKPSVSPEEQHRLRRM